MLAGELDDKDSVPYDAAATDTARASRPAPAEVIFDRGARLYGGVSYTDLDVVGS